MTTRSSVFAVSLAACAGAFAACASSDAEPARTAADPAIVAQPPPSSSVLRPDFDPQSLAPRDAAPADSAHGHHHHHHP